jgi:hypothetical protein
MKSGASLKGGQEGEILSSYLPQEKAKNHKISDSL